MCSSCLEASMEAAYSDGFQKEDDEFVLIEEDEPEQFSFMSWFRKDRGDNDNE